MESKVKVACVVAVCVACLHGTASRSFAVMDLVGVNGFYSLISMALNVGRTPLPAGVAPTLKPMPK